MSTVSGVKYSIGTLVSYSVDEHLLEEPTSESAGVSRTVGRHKWGVVDERRYMRIKHCLRKNSNQGKGEKGTERHGVEVIPASLSIVIQFQSLRRRRSRDATSACIPRATCRRAPF